VARFRHQQATSVQLHDEAPAEGDEASAEDEEPPEKIEVHVHVHHDDKARRAKRRPVKLPLSGTLFDWKDHYDQIFKRPPPRPEGAGPHSSLCPECKAPVSRMARRCTRCGAQRSTHVLTKVAAMLGLGVVALVFGMCAHLLGGSTASYTVPKPLGDWSESDVVIVTVPSEPSPFSYSDSTKAGDDTGRVATR
jgi:hypothetical protein